MFVTFTIYSDFQLSIGSNLVIGFNLVFRKLKINNQYTVKTHL